MSSIKEIEPTYPVAEARKVLEAIVVILNHSIETHGPNMCLDIIVSLVNNVTANLGISRNQFVAALDYSIAKTRDNTSDNSNV